jgi:hypothetical protein
LDGRKVKKGNQSTKLKHDDGPLKKSRRLQSMTYELKKAHDGSRTSSVETDSSLTLCHKFSFSCIDHATNYTPISEKTIIHRFQRKPILERGVNSACSKIGTNKHREST